VPKLAVIGANGQVGAELCLLLRRMPSLQLVPVCRNPTGSAFLRYAGVPCRHGRIANAAEAQSLIGDCDVIVNCALGSGTPRDIRELDRALIHNVFKYSAPAATVIHCSTLMVHGDPRRGLLVRRRDPYGRAKLATERRVIRASDHSGKAAYILRLGHVCGPLQNITHKIQDELRGGRACLYESDVASNTVYTITIVDALLAIIGGRERPGVYDLTNVPQWSWREVYDYERRICGATVGPTLVAGPGAPSWSEDLRTSIKSGVRRLARARATRRLLDGWLALMPESINARARSTWFRLRAAAEIAALGSTPVLAPELSWIALDRRRLQSLQSTATLLEGPYAESIAFTGSRWPLDLQLANPASTQPVGRHENAAPAAS
jgi:nucleoside-diphosphate-sugar epimerase